MADEHVDSDILHEALDRTHCVSRHIQDILCDHPGVMAVADAAAKITSAVELLEGAYQILGEAMHKAIETEAAQS